MATLVRPAESDTPLATLDISRAERFRDDEWQAPFARLRREAPVHFCPASDFGPYWSVTRYADIVHVESLPDIYSSSWERGGITLLDLDPELPLPMFIAMDRPQHSAQRRTVAPAFTPSEMQRLADSIRQRTAALLDTLPEGETFDWVDRVSIELTTQMLATLFDFPWEDRRLLPYWSDWMGDVEAAKDPSRDEERHRVLWEAADYFGRLWNARKEAAPAPDLLSMMIHSDSMSSMTPHEFIGTLVLLIVGGNDTTRSSMSGMVEALSRFPAERAKLVADPSLVANAASEIIRWQTPLAYMRRTTTQDTELGGQRIAAGSKIAMWYISGNRDEAQFDDPDALRVDRPNARRHLSFGYGIHRCVGARLAELQLTILLEEMLARKMEVTQTEPATRVFSSFIHGFTRMPVEMRRG